MHRRPRGHAAQRVWIGPLLQQLLLLLAAVLAYYASAETKVSPRKAPAAAKVKAPAAVKVKAPSAAKVKAPSAAKVKAPSAAKVKAPSPAKVKAPSPAKVKAPSAAKVTSPSAVKVKAPAAAAPAAVKVKAPLKAKPKPQVAQPAAAVVTANGKVVLSEASVTPAPPAVKVKPKHSKGSATPPEQPSLAPPAVKVKRQESSAFAGSPNQPPSTPPVLPAKLDLKAPPAVKVPPAQRPAPSKAAPAVKVRPAQPQAPPAQRPDKAPPAVKVKQAHPHIPTPSQAPRKEPQAVKVKPVQPQTKVKSPSAAKKVAKAPPAVKATASAKVTAMASDTVGAKAATKVLKPSDVSPRKAAELHSLPFAAAAWHSSGLKSLRACGGSTADSVDDGAMPKLCSGGRAAQRGWQYAVNNLLLSLRHAGAAGRQELEKGLGVDLAKAVSALAEFDAAAPAGPSIVSATAAVAALAAAAAAAFRQLFSESRREWLASLPPAGTNFSGTFRSVKLPVEGHGIVDVGRVLVKLKSGFSMPMLSFSTQPPPTGPQLSADVLSALEAGCKHLDIAPGLPSELAVGEAVERFVSKADDSIAAREQLFLTLRPESVAWDRPSSVAVTLAAQLKALHVDYVDLYLLPGPGPNRLATARIWEAYEALLSTGQSRSLGVANCTASEIEALLETAKVQPHVVRTTYSIYAPGPGAWEGQDKDVLDQVARPKGMVMLADGVLSGGPALLAPLDDPHVRAIAEAHSRSTSHVLLRWAMQRGMAVVISRTHRQESAGAFTFELSEYEMAVLSHLAVLAETTPWPRPGARHRPLWKADVFSLMRAAAMLEPLLGAVGSSVAQAA